MKEFNKNNLLEGYGLSCIENYLLYLLAAYNKKWECLFYRSYQSFCKIFINFYINNVKYAYFDGVPRLHKVGENIGICNITYYKEDSVENLFENNNILAVCVKPEYISDKYKTKLWRNDHYILIQKKERNLFQYLNDNPKDDGYFNMNELNNIYVGKAVKYEINNIDPEKMNANNFLRCFSESIDDREWCDIEEILIGDIDINIARDTIGILKVIIKRIIAFCGSCIDVDFLSKYYQFLEDQFVRLEYMRLRKQYTSETIKEILLRINNEDKQIGKQLKEGMDNIWRT